MVNFPSPVPMDLHNEVELDPMSKTVPERCLSVAEIERKYLSFGMPLPIPRDPGVGSDESFEQDFDDNILDDDLIYQARLDRQFEAVNELRKNKRPKNEPAPQANKHHEMHDDTPPEKPVETEQQTK